MTRRALLRGSAGALVPTLLAGCSSPPEHSSPPAQRFTRPLVVPAELRPVRSDRTTDYYQVVQRAETVDLVPGGPTTIWGYDGTFPGPTIRARRGRTVSVQHTNRLGVHTVVHLHGGVAPPASDGFPTDMVLPGASRTYVYPNDQPAATLWYHDHVMDQTGQNVYRGLAGLYLIDDEDTDRLPLPRGEFDLPLILQTRQFGPDGQLIFVDAADRAPSGTVLVNGVAWPRLEVARRRYRFRVLNATNAHHYRLGLSSGGPITLIGTDGGLLPAPSTVTQFTLGEAERVDVVVDFARYPLGTVLTLLDRNATGAEAAVMRFAVVRNARDDSTVPGTLAAVPALGPGVRTRTFRFANKGINGRQFDPDQPMATVPYGDTEVWTLSGSPKHTAHLHLVQFQVLTRGGRAPEATERGWKDTVRLGADVRVAARFTGYRGRYLMHCHNLPHEDHGMMARFDVV